MILNSQRQLFNDKKVNFFLSSVELTTFSEGFSKFGQKLK